LAIAEGRLAYLMVAEDGKTPTYQKVGKRVDLSLNLSRNENEAPHADDEGWTEYLMGRRNATIDGTVRYDESDAGQQALIDHYFGDKEILIKFALETGSGKAEYTGKGFITNLTPSPPDEGPTDMSISIRINGKLEKETQTAEQTAE
jgi:hypothetical protein